MLAKYKMEEIEMDSLKRRLFCELEMYEDKVCACKGELSEHDVHAVYLLAKTLYYLECITDDEEHHKHIHYKPGDMMPDRDMDHVHHHFGYKEEDAGAARMVKKEVVI